LDRFIRLLLGIPFNTIEKEFDSREDVIVWMVDNQKGRRNLNDFQRTELQLKKNLLAVEMRAAPQLVIDAIADISDLQTRIAQVDGRFDE
jgi:hypothetical protein